MVALVTIAWRAKVPSVVGIITQPHLGHRHGLANATRIDGEEKPCRTTPAPLCTAGRPSLNSTRDQNAAGNRRFGRQGDDPVRFRPLPQQQPTCGPCSSPAVVHPSTRPPEHTAHTQNRASGRQAPVIGTGVIVFTE